MLNTLCLQGRLVRDPETKYGQSGTAVCKMTLVQDQPAAAGKSREEAEALFLDVVGFGKTAEFMQTYFAKGKEAVAEGRLSCRSYVNRDGVKVKAWELVASRVHFCGPKQGEALSVPAERVEYAGVPAGEPDEIDPFADEI